MRLAILLALVVLLGTACGTGDTLPTSPSGSSGGTGQTNGTERFDGIINLHESKFYPFSVGSNGTTAINLASLSPINRPGVINATMEIGWGKTIKDADGNVVGCDLAKVMQTTPALA